MKMITHQTCFFSVLVLLPIAAAGSSAFLSSSRDQAELPSGTCATIECPPLKKHIVNADQILCNSDGAPCTLEANENQCCVMLWTDGAMASSRSFWSDADDKNRKDEKYQCDRDCQLKYDFWDRTIIGNRVGPRGSRLPNTGGHCKCYQGKPTGQIPVGGECGADRCPDSMLLGGSRRRAKQGLIERAPKVDFDTTDTWSGTATTGFNSPYVCVQTAAGEETMTRDAATSQGAKILHCGKCAVCSSMADIEVLSRTRKWITSAMTKASTEFAKPTGHNDLKLLQANLRDLGMNFSIARPDGRTDRPTCMDCWTDNIMCDSNNCKMKCLGKFFDPDNSGKDISQDECLQCDETYCGPQFIKCAGANRRSSGIISDIPRPEREACTVGVYYGVSEEKLPTAPQPSDKEIYGVLCPNGWHGVVGECGIAR